MKIKKLRKVMKDLRFYLIKNYIPYHTMKRSVRWVKHKKELKYYKDILRVEDNRGE